MTFEEYLSSLKGKTVGVIGVGVSNRPLIEKLLERGIDVTARDKKEDLGELGQALTAQGCKLRLGSGYLADLHENVIFRTPGLRPDVPELAAAVAGGSVITSEMEAFFAVCPCPILAVTVRHPGDRTGGYGGAGAQFLPADDHANKPPYRGDHQSGA